MALQVANDIMTSQVTFLSKWTLDVIMTEKLTVTRELQLNDWRIKVLKPEIEKFGLDYVEENLQNRFSLFGTSRPDFVF